jgi:hypothetical protein
MAGNNNHRGMTPARALALILELGKGDRFMPHELSPGKPGLAQAAVAQLVARRLVVRVSPRCGEWFYRLADAELAGRIAAGVEPMPTPGGHFYTVQCIDPEARQPFRNTRHGGFL